MSGRLPAPGEAVAWLRGARTVTALGALGVLLGAACLVAAAVRGVHVPPEGDLLETAVFNGSVGVFLLTMAALVPLVSFSVRGYRVWTGVLVVATLYSFGIETVQALRGLDPRFSHVAPDIDRAAGGIFFVMAVIIMCCFLVLAAKFFRGPATPMALAVRYGAAASLVGFGVGILMSSLNGRVVLPQGNLLPLHAFGFHGLQAVPLVALLLARGGVADTAARGWVHVAGLAWLGACLSITAQAALGRAPLEGSPAAVAAAGLLLAWAATVLVALRARPARA